MLHPGLVLEWLPFVYSLCTHLKLSLLQGQHAGALKPYVIRGRR